MANNLHYKLIQKFLPGWGLQLRLPDPGTDFIRESGDNLYETEQDLNIVIQIK